MQVKTNELIGNALNWAVGVALGYKLSLYEADLSIQARVPGCSVHDPWKPARYWQQGGPIIEREGLCLRKGHSGWWIAHTLNINDIEQHMAVAPTPLIAAMRCYVTSKLGNTVEIPDALMKVQNV